MAMMHNGYRMTVLRKLAMRFAEQGINSVAIDYFGRTAGVDKRNDPAFTNDSTACGKLTASS